MQPQTFSIHFLISKVDNTRSIINALNKVFCYVHCGDWYVVIEKVKE
jgi:hypothetical protein